MTDIRLPPDSAAPPARGPKKSETLEIRISHPLKQRFMAYCREQGDTASDIVRRLIEAAMLERPAQEPPQPIPGATPFPASLAAAAHAAAPLPANENPGPELMGPPGRHPLLSGDAGHGTPRRLAWTALAAGLAGLVGLAVDSTPTYADPDVKAMFDRFDTNKDGTISAEEFQAGAPADRVQLLRSPRVPGVPPVPPVPPVPMFGQRTELPPIPPLPPMPPMPLPAGVLETLGNMTVLYGPEGSQIVVVRSGDAPGAATPAQALRVERSLGNNGGARTVTATDGDGTQIHSYTDADGKKRTTLRLSHAGRTPRGFGEADTDGDGALSWAEFEAFHKKRAEAARQGLDRNKDGRVTEADFVAMVPPPEDYERLRARMVEAFRKLDRDGNGEISDTELLPTPPSPGAAPGIPASEAPPGPPPAP